MGELNTVNVIEYTGGAVLSVKSFSDDADGNKEAEKLFEAKAIENSMAPADLDACLDDGLFEQSDYQVFIAHSS